MTGRKVKSPSAFILSFGRAGAIVVLKVAAARAFFQLLEHRHLTEAENPLASISVCRAFLQTIQRNAERMRNLVNDISELSLIESGAVRLCFDDLPLHSVVSEVFNGLAPRSQKHSVRLRNEVPENCYVVADRRRLEQILTNLVDNAIKFTPPEGEVVVSSLTAEDFIEVRVRDTGVGIAPEHLPRVFERFYRVDKARSRELGGTGLGLAIVKHLTRAHGGDAEVTSEVGQGCEFTIKLPKRKAPESETL